MDFMLADHIVKTICIHARRIHHISGMINSTVGNQFISLFHLFNIQYFCIESEVNSICVCIFSQCNIQMERADNPSRRCIQSCVNPIYYIRFHLKNLFPVQNLKPLDSVRHSTVIQRLKLRHVFFGKTDHKRAPSLERKIQIFRKLLHHLISLYVQFCHQRSCRRIVTGMHNCAVCFGCSAAHIFFLLQYAGLDLIAGKFSRCRRS